MNMINRWFNFWLCFPLVIYMTGFQGYENNGGKSVSKNLKTLATAANTLRTWIWSDKSADGPYSHFTVNPLTMLLFIKCNRPPMNNFKPHWLRSTPGWKDTTAQATDSYNHHSIYCLMLCYHMAVMPDSATKPRGLNLAVAICLQLSKNALTRRLSLRLKCTKFNFGCGSTCCRAHHASKIPNTRYHSVLKIVTF